MQTKTEAIHTKYEIRFWYLETIYYSISKYQVLRARAQACRLAGDVRRTSVKEFAG